MKDWPGGTPPKNRPTTQPRPELEILEEPLYGKEYVIRGHKVRMYAIGQVARALGRRPVTLRKWETQDRLPPALFRTAAPASPSLPDKRSAGRRLYTEGQVRALRDGADKFGIDTVTPDWASFKKYLKLHWRDGLPAG